MADKVVVGYLSGGHTTHGFTKSLSAATAYMMTSVFTVEAFPQLVGSIPKQSGPRIADGRNRLVKHFLELDAEWLFMVDDDMTFPPDAIEQLLKAAHPETRPIVGGLAFAGGRDGWYPTMFIAHEKGFSRAEGWNDGLVEVDATGGACLLIHRSVFEKLHELYGDTPWPWFQETSYQGEQVGEDITFCFRARAAGYPIYVDTRVEFGHLKLLEIDRAFYEQWRMATRFVVTGTGRSGTGYLAAVMSTLGVPCGHEAVYTSTGHEWGWRRGDASWLAAPYLPHFAGYVLHLVRDPLAVINSMAGIRFFHDDARDVEEHGTWRRFAEEHAPQVFELLDPVERAMAWYVAWNEMIEPYADHRVRVEDVTADDLAGLFKAADAKHAPYEIQAGIDKVDTAVNSRRRASLTWDDLPDGDTKDQLEVMAKEYGYER